MVHQDTIRIKIAGHRDMHGITAQVAEIVARSKVRTGTAHVFMLWTALCVAGCASQSGRPPSRSERSIYSSSNLAGHSVAAEKLGGTACSEADVSIQSLADYGEVVSNVRLRDVFVNAIGHKKFVERLPSGERIGLGTYRYTVSLQLPLVPKPDLVQQTNPQAVHAMIQLWDGRNALCQGNQSTMEGTIYWDLNPWTPAEFGKIKVYAYPLRLIDTGLMLTPDTAWHTFELAVDLRQKKYVSIAIDGQTRNLGNIPLAEVKHTDWGHEVALVITTESLAAWPKNSEDRFTWTTRFRNVCLTGDIEPPRIRPATTDEDPAGAKKANDAVLLTGTWRVTTDRGDAIDMKLVQDGDAFAGEVDAGKVTGRIDGNRIAIELAGGAAQGTGVVTDDSMAGEYAATEEGQAGKWEATRDKGK